MLFRSQVNQAMSQIEGVTQQNAALVEEAAAAATSLQDQASELTSAVVAFKIEQDRNQSAAESVAEVIPSSDSRIEKLTAAGRTRLARPA